MYFLYFFINFLYFPIYFKYFPIYFQYFTIYFLYVLIYFLEFPIYFLYFPIYFLGKAGRTGARGKGATTASQVMQNMKEQLNNMSSKIIKDHSKINIYIDIRNFRTSFGPIFEIFGPFSTRFRYLGPVSISKTSSGGQKPADCTPRSQILTSRSPFWGTNPVRTVRIHRKI